MSRLLKLNCVADLPPDSLARFLESRHKSNSYLYTHKLRYDSNIFDDSNKNNNNDELGSIPGIQKEVKEAVRMLEDGDSSETDNSPEICKAKVYQGMNSYLSEDTAGEAVAKRGDLISDITYYQE
ncbi:Hypothetical predicted protein [Octopus vulgaris]|uniref:Uncharacterized protein n=1 Tax=Octopus vulgaris TaxID=6645 RepID=A0AA36BDZ4_OCTVU|nr:Hypothetical predicted protein [Octopus vulgaris]